MVKQQNREIIRRSRLTDNLLWLLRWPRLLCSWAINWVFDTFFERIIEIKIEDKSDVDFLARCCLFNSHHRNDSAPFFSAISSRPPKCLVLYKNVLYCCKCNELRNNHRKPGVNLRFQDDH